jgi:hypothetical protein
MTFKSILFALLISLISLTGVSNANNHPLSPRDEVRETRKKEIGSVLNRDKSSEGFTIFGKTIGGSEAKKPTPIKESDQMAHILPVLVNPYLWQAALEAVEFMPLLVSDSAGGVISTDWYEDTSYKNERYKFNILIKSMKLEKSALKVVAFKQIYKDARWQDVKINSAVASGMKDDIFSRAQQFQAQDKSGK